MKEVEAATGGAVDASVVTYTPSDNTKWNSNTDPGDTDDTLNQLASRVKTLETSISAMQQQLHIHHPILVSGIAASTLATQMEHLTSSHHVLNRSKPQQQMHPT